MDKLLTITVPSYNVEKYLEETIPTFLRKEVLDDIEILLVNDGSKDNTAVIGKKLEESYPGTVFLVNKENGGHGSTINKGIELAHGKYFKVVDGDDWVDSDEFVKYIELLRKTDTDLVMTPYKTVNQDSGEVILQTFTGIKYNFEYDFAGIIETLGDQYQMHSTTFKTEILRKIPKISEHCFYVDQEYILYPLQYLKNVIFYDCPIYQYRIGNADQSVSRKNQQKNRNMHRRVIENLMNYANDSKLSDVINNFLEKRLVGLCCTQMVIYLSMEPSDEIEKEFVDFSDMVKTKNRRIYEQIPGTKMKLLRLSNNKFYKLMSKMTK